MKNFQFPEICERSKCRGIFIGIGIALFVIGIVVIGVMKFMWLKKQLCCGCNLDDFDDFYESNLYLDDEDDDDLDDLDLDDLSGINDDCSPGSTGCAFAGDKDFV